MSKQQPGVQWPESKGTEASFRLRIWRQEGPDSPGALVDYTVEHICSDTSFLEMLDALNEQLILANQRPVQFDSDCREGICGMCGLVINGRPHGVKGTTTCMLRMGQFDPSKVIIVEPFRAEPFKVVCDLVVDRSALDRIIASGGFISVNVGSAPEANTIPVPEPSAEAALDAAACLGCGACAASCPNGSAWLFTAAKVAHLADLPQGRVQAAARVQQMVAQMDKEGFGGCSSFGECEAVCPQGISLAHIGQLQAEFRKALMSY